MLSAWSEVGSSECLVESGGSSDGKAGDRINLSKIDAISETANNVAFTFIGTEKLSKKAGELRDSKRLSDTHFYGISMATAKLTSPSTSTIQRRLRSTAWCSRSIQTLCTGPLPGEPQHAWRDKPYASFGRTLKRYARYRKRAQFLCVVASAIWLPPHPTRAGRFAEVHQRLPDMAVPCHHLAFVD